MGWAPRGSRPLSGRALGVWPGTIPLLPLQDLGSAPSPRPLLHEMNQPSTGWLPGHGRDVTLTSALLSEDRSVATPPHPRVLVISVTPQPWGWGGAWKEQGFGSHIDPASNPGFSHSPSHVILSHPEPLNFCILKMGIMSLFGGGIISLQGG